MKNQTDIDLRSVLRHMGIIEGELSYIHKSYAYEAQFNSLPSQIKRLERLVAGLMQHLGLEIDTGQEMIAFKVKKEVPN